MELSAIRLDAYLQCPLKYRFRYIDKIESEEVSAALVFGSAVHGTLKHVYRRLMAGQRLTIEEAEAAFREDFEARFAVPVKMNGQTPEQLKEQGLTLIRAYIESVPEPVIPVAIEQEIHAPIINLITGEKIEGVGIMGILDRVEAHDRPIELKTSSQSYSQLRVDISLQFTIYAYLLAYHSQVDGIDGGYEILVKLKTPKLQRLVTRRTLRDFDRLFRTIDSVLNGIESGIFHPNPSHMFCPSCDYAAECAKW